VLAKLASFTLRDKLKMATALDTDPYSARVERPF
jgi:hypothetical protein